ncbi:tetratricopeptide repeat protein 22-like isoform X2 [Patiria miniata]|uniref:Uncharacterized protein n=1 Tax=Patiria miniata TaxID=46514 RepID=A0A914BS45_PATMI|nr:tetratricopeptide repeat protein 22-like isoform X2 [Patiria miniata]
MAAADLPVGHFQLQLLTNRGPIVEVTANYKRMVLEDYLQRKQNRPERHAIRHLLGVLAFAQDRDVPDRARERFEFILSEDPDNLNAKANLAYVNGTAAPPYDEPDLTSEASKQQHARRFAEQGYAYMFELFDETKTCDRYEKGLDLYNRAMELAGDLVDHTEKEDWQFCIGLASYKILRILATGGDGGQRAQSLLESASGNFRAIVDSPHADNAIKSEAWLQFALTLKKGSEMGLHGRANIAPEHCLDRALELAPDDSLKARILARQAHFTFKTDRNEGFRRARALLDSSIDFDNSSLNFHAYSLRAEICIKQYRRSKNIALITRAKDDLEFILQQHVSPWDFERLAEAYLYLAKSSIGEESRDYIRKGLETCTKCEGCQDGAGRSILHHVRGQILCLNGQHQEAMESFQIGIACEENTGWISGNVGALAEERRHVERQYNR